jgi:Rap1a immunity proteins
MIDMYQREKAVQTAICVPAGVGVTSRQLRDAAVKYLEQHPADRYAAASSLVWSALKDAWPCRALTPQGYMRY